MDDDDAGSGADTVRIEVRDNDVSGGGFAAKVQMSGEPESAPIAPVQLPLEGGGPFKNSVASVDLPGILSTGLLEVSTEGQRSGTTAFVESSADQASTGVGGSLLAIEVGHSQCRAAGSGSTASAPVASLTVNGETLLDLSPAPNSEIAVPGGVLVLNEQAITSRPAVPHPLGGFVSFGSTSVTVTGAHLQLQSNSSMGAGDIYLSQSRCALEGPAVVLP